MREPEPNGELVDEELRRKYERAWSDPVPPTLEDFVPGPDSPRRRNTIAELVCIEIEKLWMQHAGKETSPSKSIESYLRQFPELRTPETTKQLIEQELLMHEQLGRAIDVARYTAQYPDAVGLMDTELLSRREFGTTSNTPWSAENSPPRTLGNYDLQECIGSGGMGRVYLARHKQLGTLAAVKVVQKFLANVHEVQLRFRREGRAAAQLRHEHIASAFDAGEDGEWNFIVFEYVEGDNLQEVVAKNGPLSQAEAVHFIRQAASGLAAAHRQGFVHRDVKPANLMVNKDGVIKVLDLGLAGTLTDEETSQLTKINTLMGTLDFMAPEQALDPSRVDARADIYSLGCTLYYLLTGKRLYDGANAMARLAAHRDQPIPTLVPASRDTHVGLQKIFRKMVAKQPDDRFSSMDEVNEALGKLSRDSGRKTVSVGAVAVLILGLASIIALTVFALSRPGNSVTHARTTSEGRQLLAIGATLYIEADGEVTRIGPHEELPEGPIEIVGLEPPNNGVSEAELSEAIRNTNLKELYLDDFALTTEGLQRILASAPQLLRLHLGGTDLSDVDLSSLRELKSLETLWIGRTSLSDEQMKAVAAIRPLGYLWMGENPITDIGVRELSSLKNLRGLGIERTSVSADCLAYLEPLSLQTLILDGNDFDDDDIPSLSRLTSLKKLSLIDTDISEQGRRRLQEALPNCDMN